MMNVRRLVVSGRPCQLRGLEEFFDRSGSGQAVRTGRAWRASELRLKSHDDLHKLWYVLLKEKNMLLTEKRISLSLRRQMANPERLHKVKLSMARLKTVVNERSRQHKMERKIEALRNQIKAEMVELRENQELDDLIDKTRNEVNMDEILAQYDAFVAQEKAKEEAAMAKKETKDA